MQYEVSTKIQRNTKYLSMVRDNVYNSSEVHTLTPAMTGILAMTPAKNAQ